MKQCKSTFLMKCLMALLCCLNSLNVYSDTYTDKNSGIIYEYSTSLGMIVFFHPIGFDDNYVKSNVTFTNSIDAPELGGKVSVSLYYNFRDENATFTSSKVKSITIDIDSETWDINKSRYSSWDGEKWVTKDEYLKGWQVTFNCENLESFNLPSGLTSLTGLTINSKKLKLKFPNNIKVILGCSFNCKSVEIPKSVKDISGTTFTCEDINISEGIEGISGFTINDCELVLPNSVKAIGGLTINGCKELVIPNSVKAINSLNVASDNLTRLEFPNSLDVKDYIAIKSTSLTSIKVPDGIKTFSKYNEKYQSTVTSSLNISCPALKSITIPKSVESAYGSYGCFFQQYCPHLETVYFNDDVTSIPSDLFDRCLSLRKINFPSNLKEIGNRAFWGCIGLKSLTIPKTVESIGWRAFGACYGLEDIYVYWPIPVEADADVFYSSRIPESWGYYTYKFEYSNGEYVQGDFFDLNKYTVDIYANAVLHLESDPNKPMGDTSGPSMYRYKRTLPWKLFRHIKHDGGVTWNFTATVTASGNGKVEYDYWSTDANGNATAETNEVRNETKVFKIATSWVPMVDEFKIVLDEGSTLESVLVNGKDVTDKVEINTKDNTGTLTVDNISEAYTVQVKFSGAETPKDDVTLTAKSYTREYGEENPAFEYTVSDGTITSGTPTISCTATATSPVGTYDIVIEKGTVSNSTVNLVKGTLTITQAPLTISAGNYTKVEGEDNPTFTPTFSGFKNSETKTVLTKQPTVTTTATKESPAGSYTVTVSGAEAQNYDITYQNGTLTITPKVNTEPEAYAVLTDDGKTVTFYYDTQKSNRSGMVEINNDYLGIAQTTDTHEYVSLSPYGEATQAIFDESFAEYRPTSTAFWFTRCYKLASISGIKNLNTSEVTDMQSMFNDCSSLTSLDVSGFNTSNVTLIGGMFSGCSSMTDLDVSKFNTTKVTDMQSMFSGCSSLTSIDVSGFSTSNVTGFGMSGMFKDCSSLTILDLSSFDTGKITWPSTMFIRCASLETIYVSDKWTMEKVEGSANMFKDCTSLVGGKGTKYDADHVDAAYAHIDGGTENPGYLTDKNASAVEVITFADAKVKALADWYDDNLERKDVNADGNDETLTILYRPTYYFLGLRQNAMQTNPTLHQTVGWHDLGRNADGRKAVVGYFIMGRSENSRNRVFEKTEDGIRTEAHDPAKVKDPSLIIYHPVRAVDRKSVV